LVLGGELALPGELDCGALAGGLGLATLGMGTTVVHPSELHSEALVDILRRSGAGDKAPPRR
jgi:hypothetical protein